MRRTGEPIALTGFLVIGAVIGAVFCTVSGVVQRPVREYVCERYPNPMQACTPHSLFSVPNATCLAPCVQDGFAAGRHAA